MKEIESIGTFPISAFWKESILMILLLTKNLKQRRKATWERLEYREWSFSLIYYIHWARLKKTFGSGDQLRGTTIRPCPLLAKGLASITSNNSKRMNNKALTQQQTCKRWECRSSNRDLLGQSRDRLTHNGIVI